MKPEPDPQVGTVQTEPATLDKEASEPAEKKPRRRAAKVRPGLIRQDSQGLYMEL